MSTSRSSSPSGFDAEAYRQLLADRLTSPAPSVSGASVSSGSATLQPSSRSRYQGRGGLPRGGVNTGGTMLTARAGVSSGGGLSGKSSTKFPVTRMPVLFCRGVIKSTTRGMGSLMCIRDRCSFASHQVKVEDFPDEPTFCLEVGRGKALAYPHIKLSDCQPDIEAVLDSMESSEEEWIQFCEVMAEKVAKQKVEAKKQFVPNEDGYADGMELVERLLKRPQPIPRRPKVELDPAVMDKGEEDPVARALLNMLEFMKSTDDALEYVSFFMEDSQDNDVTIADRLDYVTELVMRISAVIGDREFISNEFDTLAEAIYKLEEEGNSAIQGLRDMEIKAEDLAAKLEMQVAIANEETAKALDQIKKDVEVASTRPETTTPTTTDLSVLLDDAGRLFADLEIGMVQGKIWTLADIITTMLDLKKDVADLQSMVAAKGGVAIGSTTFASVDELRDLIKRELPSGVKAGVIRCFVDAITLFVHVDEVAPSDQASYKKLNEHLTSQDCALINTAHSSMCPQYTGTAKEYNPGKPIQCFSNPEGWDGEGLEGKQSSIADDAEKSASKLAGLAPNMLKDAPTLLSLALLMADRSEKWHNKFHAHLASELKTLAKLKLPKVDIFILFSDLFRLIVELFYAERATVHAVDDHVDSVERLTVIIWTTLKVHGLMQDFLDAKFKNHPIVQSAFVRFLTTKIGQNTAAALSSNVTVLEKKVSSLDTKVDAASKKAKEAASSAKAVSDNLAALKSKNPQLNK